MARSKQQFTAIAFTFEAGLGLLAIFLGRILGFDPLEKIGFGQPISEWALLCVYGIAAAIPMLLGLVILDRLPSVLADFKAKVSEIVVPMFRGLSLWEVAALSAAAGFGEELLFRGLIQAGLQVWLDQPSAWILALAVASIAFGICHWLDATYAILATGVGIYLGGLFLFTDDLIVPIIAHAVYDFVAILYLTRGERETPVSPPRDDATT